jgi:hypothetical protein
MGKDRGDDEQEQNIKATPVVVKVRTIARPLKTLIPTIQSGLQQGNDAGHDHYRRAGEMLIEAKDLVGHGGWTRWLNRNFDLGTRMASTCMRWAREHYQIGNAVSEVPYGSLLDMTGATERDRNHAKAEQTFRRLLRDIARDDFVQEKQDRDAEVKLYRDPAADIIDAGYRVVAKKLHPDRGGSQDVMVRLNHVRDGAPRAITHP